MTGSRPVIEKRQARLRRPNMRRAAPALPNGFTLGNLFFGIFAIVSASHQQFGNAVLYIVLGGVCDAFDGAVARATRSGSRFGEELDSLVDAISFGLAPAMIVYFLVLPQNRWGLLAVFIFCACAVIRLARFNVTQAGESKTYFIGLPSPAAGGTLATYYWFTQTPLYNQTRIVDLPWQEIMPGLMLLLAAMMISPVPYPAWPKVGVKSWKAVGGLLAVLGIVIGATLYSKYFFFLFGIAYVSYGLIRAVVLSLVEWPVNGHPRRRATDYVDPMEAYGGSPLVPVTGGSDHADRAARTPTPRTAAAAHDVDEQAHRRRRRRHRRHGDGHSGPAES